MASSGGIWVPMAQRVLRQALTTGTKVTKVLRNQIAAATRGELEPVSIRSTPPPYHPSGYARQPVHPLAFRRQAKNGSGAGRWFSSSSAAARRFFSNASSARHNAPRYVDQVAFLQSRVGSHAVWKASGRAPFAATLRPNLTGGALPRTAGGYSLGAGGSMRSGGARYFSHTPAAPAQVVQNVSQAMRAFWVSGHRARFDGTDARGRPAYKAISALEEEVARRVKVPAMPALAPGAFVDFPLKPTITALTPLAAVGAAAAGFKAAAPTATLGTEGFLDVLSVDFSRALNELSAVMNDLKRLADLGDLPVLLDGGTTLRVRFPGVDAATVDRLCDDLGITRGIVGQDPGFDRAMGANMALRFPFAPDKTALSLDSVWDDGNAAVPGLDVLTSPAGSLRSHQSSAFLPSEESFDVGVYEAYVVDGLGSDAGENPWLSLDSGDEDGYASMSPPPVSSSGEHASQEFEGVEGIYRFLEECDRMQGRF